MIDDSDNAARIAEGEQLLAENDDLLRLAVGFREFFGQQHRNPEPAQQFAHARTRARLGQEFVVLGAEHGKSSRRSLLPARLARTREDVNAERGAQAG
ncbi:hypothetical protein [Bradyrhizobium sp. 136]|uniref:hypothetical protein n=1 Tax=unclassified Bradyrhizobium TaxID=2631580 RepID=UPI001FF9BD70